MKKRFISIIVIGFILGIFSAKVFGLNAVDVITKGIQGLRIV